MRRLKPPEGRVGEMTTPEAVIDIAAALMTDEDIRELGVAAQRHNRAAQEFIRAMREFDETKQRIRRRAFDRVPKSVFGGGA